MRYELVQKPTFTTQFLAISREEVARVLERFEPLRDDPPPDAKIRKALKGQKQFPPAAQRGLSGHLMVRAGVGHAACFDAMQRSSQ